MSDDASLLDSLRIETQATPERLAHHAAERAAAASPITEAEADALVTTLELGGYKYWGGWGANFDRHGEHWGGTWKSKTEGVSISWLQPPSSEVRVRVSRWALA